ncbi:hypothetical protein [Paraburkholderia adhaesiva]|uniref:hypothetical protein n=1 Tax=Paraburkholderia adhaesiva TaxID=2883244 RepID=UPI001F3DFF39|nr:hypothetical protein [Paraburkholderia adhaesiva]
MAEAEQSSEECYQPDLVSGWQLERGRKTLVMEVEAIAKKRHRNYGRGCET